MIFAPETTISLDYVCGCTQTWLVHRIPEGEEAHRRSPEPCIPASCPTCQRFGRPCATRAEMAAACAPVQFSEVVPAGRAHYKRMKAS